MSNLLKIKDVTEILGVTRTCLYSLIRDGKFPKGIKIGGSRRWRSEAVEQFLKEKEEVSESEDEEAI